MARPAMNLAFLLLLGFGFSGSAAAQAAKVDIDVDKAKLIDLKTIRLDLLGDLKKSQLLQPLGILLLGSNGERVEAEVVASNDASEFHPLDPDAVARFLVVPPAGKEFSLGETYTLVIRFLEDARARVKPGVVQVEKLKGSLEVTPLRPDRINVIFFGPNLRMSTKKDDIKVQVKRNGSVRELKLARLPETDANSQNMVLYINPLTPVQHGDVLMVTTILQGGGGQVVSTTEIKAPKPKDKASSLVFLSMAAESGKGQDPAINLDLKVANPYLVPLWEGGNLGSKLSSWTMGPALEAEISSTDKNNTNKFSNFLDFRGYVLDTQPGRRWKGFVFDVGPKLEFETAFSNRNAIASAQGEMILLGEDLKCRPGSKDKNCWIIFRPMLGAEAGTNFGLEGDHESLDGYSIARGLAGFYFSWTRKFLQDDANGTGKIPQSGLNAVSFSIDGRARYLFQTEADFEPNPGGRENPDGSTSSLVEGDGVKPYGKATLSFAVSENYAITLEYSNGERPPLFKDEDKVKLTFALAF